MSADAEAARLAAATDRAIRQDKQLRVLWESLASAPVRGWSGPGDAAEELAYRPDAREDTEAYREWVRRGADAEAKRCVSLRDRLTRGRELAGVTVLVRATREGARQIGRCLASLDAQIHAPLEVFVFGEAVQGLRGEPAGTSLRGEVLPEEQPAAALQAALERSQGEFLTVVEADDVLPPSALAEVAALFESADAPDVIYTDEDRIDEAGELSEPCFKPGWSPDTLLSHMYLGRLLVVTRPLLRALGTPLTAPGEAWAYDLVLRAVERGARIAHLPRVLCHRGRPAGHVEGDDPGRPEARRSAKRVLREALHRGRIEGEIEEGRTPGAFRVRRQLGSDRHVSIIVPFRDGSDLLARLLRSIRLTVRSRTWEAVLVDNGSWEPETQALRKRLSRDSQLRIIDDPSPFNWSALNNRAVRQCDGDRLLFLNNDIEAVHEGWLEALLEAVEDPAVGAAGARLVYPSGRVQHAGVALGLTGIAGHVFRGCPREEEGYFGGASTVRNWSAVTGACLMVRRDVFDLVGGFDESLSVAYNDVDFCLRLGERGLRIVCTPFAELVHHESVTRGVAADAAATRTIAERWGERIAGDPFLNSNLSRRSVEMRLPEEGETLPWQEIAWTLESS